MLTDIVSYDKTDQDDLFNIHVRKRYKFMMSETLKAYFKHLPGCNVFKILIICSLIIQTSYSFAQPVWTASPSVAATHSTRIDVSYILDQNSTVYYFGLNYNYTGTFTAAQVKSFAIAGPSGQRVCTGIVPYTSPGLSASISFTNFPANTQVTLFMVAESNPGAVLQVTSIKLSASTQPCVTPDYLSGFTQSVVCVNKGASATYLINLQSMDPDVNGILSGTSWVLDWGDGTAPTNYTSTADNDIPPAGLRTHTYISVTSCNYIFSCTVISPCGSTKQNQYVAVVHGRDIAADGDGLLALVDNATGSNIITVCAGTQTDVTIRDNSLWNCQNPTVPNGFTAIPNNDPRNIEWLYGRNPSGAIMNTITGTVAISLLGNAPATSTRITPAPYGPSSISNIITIPATCQTGEYFRVYLKNWNKCNWTDPEAIETYIDINVVNAPPAPVVPDKTICLTGDKTLTVTSAPVGTIEWYSDAGLTTLVATGLTYTPTVSLPGAYDYWVTDFNGACRSASTNVTLTIRPGPGISGPPQPVRVTASNINYTADAGYTNYIWNVSSGGVITSGGTTSDNFINVTWTTEGAKTISLGYTDPGYGCTGSVSLNEFIYPLPSVNNVQISGSLTIGSTLTGSYNYTDGAGGTEGISLFRWLRNGSIVVGTGITYLISTGDQNSTLTFEVTPASTTGIPNTGIPVMSSPTSPVENLSEIPVASEVCIEGIREESNWIRGKYRYTHSLPEGNSVYKWYRGGSIISGATTMYYQLTNEDIAGNFDITFEVTPVSSNSVPNTGNTIISNPLARITLPQDDYSVAISTVPLTANTLQGVFSGAFVMNGVFYPKQAGVGGPYEILLYTSIVNTSVTCFQEASENLLVIPNESLFNGIDSVYCKDGPNDVISVNGVPPASVSLGFSLTDPDAIVSQTEWTATLSPSLLNAGIKKDILTFRYEYGGYEYTISHSLKVDSAGKSIQFVNLSPEYCSNSPKQNISVTGNYPIGGTATWSGTILSDIADATASIDVSLGTPGMMYTITCQYTTPLGCKSNLISGNIVINQAPSSLSVSTSDPLTLCLGDSATLQVTDVPGYTYQWKRDSKNLGSDSSTHEAKLAGNYTVVVSNSYGCSAASSNTITVLDANSQITTTFRVNGPTSFCQGGSVMMNVTDNPAYTYQWVKDGTNLENATTNLYTAQSTGVYALVVANSSGCRNKTEDISVIVSALPEIPLINAAGPLKLCIGDSTVMSFTNTYGYSSRWFRNGDVFATGVTSVTAKSAGIYSLVVTNANGCSVNAQNTIDLKDVNSQVTTTLRVNGLTSFCSGNSVGISVSENPDYVYQWMKDGSNITGANTSSYNAKDSGTYYLYVLNSMGCKNKTEDVRVTVYKTPEPPFINAVGLPKTCDGDSVVLSVETLPDYSYQWKMNGGAVGLNSATHSSKTSGSYSVVVTNSSGCSASSTNSIDVLFQPLPVIGAISQIGNDTKFCKGESIILSVPLNTSYKYIWKNYSAIIPDAFSNLFTARESGEYTVEVTTESGCKKIPDPVSIEVVEMPAMPSIDPGNYYPDICLGENPLRLSVKDTAAGYNYKWYKNGTPYSVSKYIDIQDGGNYYLEAIIDICTSARDSLVVKSMKTLPKPDIIAHGSAVWYLSTTSKANYYKWYYNGSAIPDTDKKIYIAHQNLGIYRVGISDDMQCFSLSDTVRIPTNITGIEDIDPFENVKIFPNPTTGLITIEMNNNIYGELEIDITTINGRKIRNIKSDKISDYLTTEIDLTDYSSGIYIINLSVGKYSAIRKIVVR